MHVDTLVSKHVDAFYKLACGVTVQCKYGWSGKSWSMVSMGDHTIGLRLQFPIDLKPNQSKQCDYNPNLTRFSMTFL